MSEPTKGRSSPAGPLPSAVTQVGHLFDSKAATWAAKYAPGGPLTSRLSQLGAAVRRTVPPGGEVLDLGCGTGDLARSLAAAGMHVTGCDISPAMLAVAASNEPESREAGAAHKPTPTIRWLILEPDWQVLPFADGSFDAVVASSVLEYTPDPVTILHECARVLRPDGSVHLTVPDLRHPVRWLEMSAWVVAGAVRIVLRPSWPRPGGHPWRLSRYLTYLRLSRQRHRLRWWRSAALGAGLRWDTVTDRPGRPQSLRLLLLRRRDFGEDGR